jgi:hypothetical protein
MPAVECLLLCGSQPALADLQRQRRTGDLLLLLDDCQLCCLKFCVREMSG